MKTLSKEAKRELNRLNKLDTDPLDMARDLYDVSIKQRDFEKAEIYAEIETALTAERTPSIFDEYESD